MDRIQESESRPTPFKPVSGSYTPADLSMTHTRDVSQAYSQFKPRQKAWIISIAAWAGWFSTASSFAYFPAIPFMANQMDVSVQQINLTVTSYLIASGFFPTITGSAADAFGRRVTLLASVSVYSITNACLAVQRSFPALFVLRMMQSAAISGGYSISYGVVADLASSAERGTYTGAMAIFLNTPPSVAPMISGLLLLRWTWQSIFWFLTIASAFIFTAMLVFLPETNRNLVGNGSFLLFSKKGKYLTVPLSGVLDAVKEQQLTVRHEASTNNQDRKLFNPFASILLLRDRGTLIASICFGIYYVVHTCLQASLSTIFVDRYHVSGLVAGLIYIPFGAGCSIASFVAGKLVDYDFKTTAAKQGVITSHEIQLNRSTFPIERARFRSTKYCVLICAPIIAAYGWTLQFTVHMAVPLALQFLFGFFNQFLYTAINTLLLDYWPGQGASAQAANNLVRCELAAVALAILDVILRRLGPGWCFVVFACLHLMTYAGLEVLCSKGLSWRCHPKR